MSAQACVDLPCRARDVALAVRERLGATPLYTAARRELPVEQVLGWRLAVQPFPLPAEVIAELEALGQAIYAFLGACNQLYARASRDAALAFVAEWLDRGKSEVVLTHGRMNRTRRDLPVLVRPDFVWTGDGLAASEIDPVPGGFGILAAMARAYHEAGCAVIGGRDGIPRAFAQALRDLAGLDHPVTAIVVSDEAGDYRPEMEALAERMRELGESVEVLHPRDVRFREDGLWLPDGRRIDVLYRFFELFDLKNVPKADLILYAARKGLVRLTPPIKAYLEEKLLFALLYHPDLEDYFAGELGPAFDLLRRVFPETWVLDPRPVPPHALIPGLRVGGRPVRDFRQLGSATKSERAFVVKPSGYSELAWGSHGVCVGPDVPQAEWQAAIDRALASFDRGPWVLQRLFKGRRVESAYYDFAQGEVVPMPGRVRLCPYYFAAQDGVRLAGVLATICPLDKKLIHGMVDAIMVPAGPQA